MKKSDLKQLIKPLVKECIHEVLIEEGLLSNVVSEVARGLASAPTAPLMEHQSAPPPTTAEMQRELRERQEHLREQKASLMSTINEGAYNGVNLFEGTEPFNSYEATEPKAGAPDLGNPGDAGVDISSLVGNASALWRAMK
jgi:hypothetical protein